MPQDGAEQNLRVESLPTQPDQLQVETQPSQPVDTGAAPDPKPAPDTSHPSEAGPKDADRSRNDAGRFSPKDSKPPAPDPVKEAIDRLVKKSEPEAPKQPGTAAADPPRDAKAPPGKPTDEGLKSRTKDDLDAPPEERARWRRDTADRFDRVLSTARSAREELEKSAPFIEQGKGYSKILDEFELHQDIGFVPPEHFAGVVKAQAAINRALISINQGRQPAPSDVETFTALASNVDKIRSQLGIQTPHAASTAPSTKPFEGELPQDLKDLVEVYGIDEKRVRMLAALEAGAKAPAQPAERAPVEPPVQLPAKPVGVDMDQLYGRKLLSEMHALGVQNPKENLRVLLQHPQTRQEVINRFPGITLAEVPAIFDSLDAPTRYEILKSAHTALTATKVPVRPSLPPPTHNRSVPTTATPRREGPAAGQDAVSAAIAHLARE